MSEQLFQVGIKGLITDKQGKILLLHMPKWGHTPEHWDLPGGRMDPGEDFIDTLKRELREELGVAIKPNPKQLLAVKSSIKISVGSDFIPLVLVAFRVTLEDTAAAKLGNDLKEDKMGWFSKEESAKLLTYKYGQAFSKIVNDLDLS